MAEELVVVDDATEEVEAESELDIRAELEVAAFRRAALFVPFGWLDHLAGCCRCHSPQHRRPVS